MSETDTPEATRSRADQPEVDPKVDPKGKQDKAARSDTLEQRRFDEEQPAGGGRREQSLEVVLDIPVTLSLELGRTRMSIRDLLQLAQGSVVKLDRPAGEPLDVLVNGCLVARGEVVVVNDRFGVRITDIVSPEERVKRLR
ncbi:MAG: flagellar motor switch protein FliN [Candidatus Competibacteraceae bacterium]|nr:flagellar motor switch protein FliN [Candidatus Competibacteraceae bacterium]